MFDIKYTLTFEDYQKFMAILSKRRLKRYYKRNMIGLGILALLMTLLWIILQPSMSELLSFGALFPVIVFGILCVLYLRIGVPKLWRKHFDAQKIGLHPIELSVDDEQLHSWQKGVETHVDWDRIEDITLGKEQLLLWLSPVQSLIIPHRAFETPQHMDAFTKFVVARTNAT